MDTADPALEAAVEAADQHLKKGEPLLAYNAVQEALGLFPDHTRLRQLQALALARSGDIERANAILESLARQGLDDAETLGLLARTHKDLGIAARDPERRGRHLDAGFELYERAYERARRERSDDAAWYTGINAAAMAVLRQDLPTARRIAAEVRTICGGTQAETRSDRYWREATLGEAALILGDMDAAALHCARGAGIWEWASSDSGGLEPDVVLACAGDVPTTEVLAAADILRRRLPALKVRVVNVVDLMRLQPAAEHPHGMADPEFDALFTTSRPVIFAYHGYPWLIHRLTYSRAGHANFHVRGYKENGTTTTPFDMLVLNDMDRFHLVMDVIDRVPGLNQTAAWLRQEMADTRIRHRTWVRTRGEDLPEVTGWTWAGP